MSFKKNLVMEGVGANESGLQSPYSETHKLPKTCQKTNHNAENDAARRLWLADIPIFFFLLLFLFIQCPHTGWCASTIYTLFYFIFLFWRKKTNKQVFLNQNLIIWPSGVDPDDQNLLNWSSSQIILSWLPHMWLPHCTTYYSSCTAVSCSYSIDTGSIETFVNHLGWVSVIKKQGGGCFVFFFYKYRSCSLNSLILWLISKPRRVSEPFATSMFKKKKKKIFWRGIKLKAWNNNKFVQNLYAMNTSFHHLATVKPNAPPNWGGGCDSAPLFPTRHQQTAQVSPWFPVSGGEESGFQPQDEAPG